METKKYANIDYAFYKMQMERDGFVPFNDHQIELYATVGAKKYNKIKHIGFNMAYALSRTNIPAQHGDYEGDMMHIQNYAEQLLYDICVASKYDPIRLDSFLEEFEEEACFENCRQVNAFNGLERCLEQKAFSHSQDI